MAQDLFGCDEVESVGQGQEKQSTKKTVTPIYEPKKVQPSLFACYDQQKYRRLLRLIDRSTVNDEEKEFLCLAATRFMRLLPTTMLVLARKCKDSWRNWPWLS